MKKVFSLIVALATAALSFAANTDVARLTLTAAGSTASSIITVRIDPTISTAEISTFFQNTDLTDNVNIYILADGAKYSSYKHNAIQNLPVGIITNRGAEANQHYTLAFLAPTITDGFTLTDLRTGTTVNITNGGSYEFDINTTTDPTYVAGSNTVIEDRFVINYVRTVDSGELELCHQNGKLTINNNPYSENIQVLDAAGVVVLDEPSTNTPQDIDLSSLSAGQYTVSLNNGARTFIIRVQ